MTVKETAALLDIMAAAYPNQFTKADREQQLRLWSAMFVDDPALLVADAVKVYIATDASGFAPSVGQVKDQIAKAAMEGMPTAIDAWNHIRAAISNSGYHAQEMFDGLTPEEQRIVGSPRQLYEWGQMDVTVLDSVVASNVQRSYGAIIDDRKYQLTLPADVKGRMEALAGKTFRRLS